MCADNPRPAGIPATFRRPPRFDDITLDVVTLKRFWANLSRRSTSDPGRAGLREWLRFRPRDGPFIAASLDINASFHPVGTSSDWLLIDCAVQVGRQGRIDGTGKVWDADGHLVATGASQLCCVPAPP
jgi:hypothetical protein